MLKTHVVFKNENALDVLIIVLDMCFSVFDLFVAFWVGGGTKNKERYKVKPVRCSILTHQRKFGTQGVFV